MVVDLCYTFTSMKTQLINVKQYELPVSVEKQKTEGFVAKCTIWPDCYAQGDTLEEAINELHYVASSLIELYQEENLTIPLKLVKTTKPNLPLSFKFPLIVSV